MTIPQRRRRAEANSVERRRRPGLGRLTGSPTFTLAGIGTFTVVVKTRGRRRGTLSGCGPWRCDMEDVQSVSGASMTREREILMPRSMQSRTRTLTGTEALGGAALSLRGLALAVPHVRVTRRTLQVVLGFFWLLDGVLQLQPFMLRASFAQQILAPVGVGQPQFVAGPVHWAANLVAAHPVAWDVPFAIAQLALGLGMLVPRTARLALAASLPWAIGVWWLGEGLSGLASGSASLLSGAPGSVSLYALLALAAWPRRGRSDVPPARWLPLAWATLWVGAAVLQLLPMNNTGADVSSAMLANGSPSWLAGFQGSFAGWITHHGTLSVVLLAAGEAMIGLAVLYRRTVAGAAAAGFLLALAIWVIAQNFGGLYTGQATDPNTAPLVMLMAVALLAGSARPREVADRLWHRS
ncbi:MAG: hypothetical protein QOJ89_5385 [bacterium]